MSPNLYKSPDLVSRDQHIHESLSLSGSFAPLSPPLEDEFDDFFRSARSKSDAQDCLSMSSPPLSRQSPPGSGLQEFNTQDLYLSAPSDPEESDFHASAIRLTPVAGSPHHSSSLTGSRRPSIQSPPYVPSKPSACLAPSDIELSAESVAWTTEGASVLNAGITASSTNATSAAANASNRLNPELNLDSAPPRGRSPIVTVSKVSRGDSPIAHQRRPSRSIAHLSPSSLGDLPSDSEHEGIGDDQRSVSSLSVARTHDGKWIRNPVTGLGGLDPSARGNEIAPSPNELKGRRDREQKNQDISLWSASVSAAHSDAGDDSLNLPSQRHQHQGNNRVRARSTGDRPFRQEDYLNLQLGSDGQPVPGPGATLHESSEEVSEGSSASGDTDIGSPPADANDPSRDDGSTPEVNSSFESKKPNERFIHPWQDPPRDQKPRAEAMQPLSSTAAMVAFEKRVKDLETASLTATIDNNSIINFGASFERLRLVDHPKSKSRRSSSLLKRPFFQASSKLKRHASDVSITSLKTATQQATPDVPQRKESNSYRHRLSLSSRHTRSPSLTNALLSMSGQMAAIGGSHSVRAVSPNPETEMDSPPPKNRSRSRSEIPRPVSPGLMDLMTTHGGPPVAGIYRSSKSQVEVEPAAASVMPRAHVGAEHDDDMEMADEKGLVMEFQPMSHLPVPTFEGFQAQVKHLSPRLDPILIHRFAHAQLRRYENLVELQQKHALAVASQTCKNGSLCFALGGEASLLQQYKTPADPEVGQSQFHIQDFNHGRDQASYALAEGAMTAAQFPPGVPLPPVSHLPAKFECPLCFEVKTFQKPSDWSKHVHEDVQPFTCSFPQCNEPKSFKRKADWVRHESERHRQLEWWTCSFPECSHTCFRKDNFVQHLVREHKLPEPKLKKANGSATADGLSGEQREQEVNRLWSIVDDCRHETEHSPAQEPCRFCGSICGSWKTLAIHLGKHMEQLAMPVAELARQSYDSTSQVKSTGIPSRSADTYPPVATQLDTQQHDAPRPASAHLAQPQYPATNTDTPNSHAFSYDVPALNYPSISGGEISMEPESITNSLQPGDQFSGYDMEQYDQGVFHTQPSSHPLHQNSVTYPPPYNAVPRPRTPEATAVMLQNSYAISSQLHPQSSLYPAQAAYPAAYQPVPQNVPYTSGPYTPSNYSSQMQS